ncbi:serine/threonine/tyrosine-protein kinase HT1 [Cajanus cajan]|uniref:serine/threonine/tyrosine-protein kinase HT1 n=1 Tax=Cajanus cajan TaxID=3821 RepID=UPI00098D7CBB|nr:serine/threonine/tyrosine-protein kinase HT1 [Cajanus cajan]
MEGLHGSSKVRGLNLGGWLVIKGWIKPSLFDGIANGDMLKAPIDPFTRESYKPSASQGVPIGGMRSGSISRGFRGEFRQWQIIPSSCEASPVMAIQFSFIAACKKPPVFCIITKYLAGGSLAKFLHHQQPDILPLKLVLKLALDIARGMQYLNSQGILYRDLKSKNLLLGEDMCVKVVDLYSS